jgi:hypothetical protein
MADTGITIGRFQVVKSIGQGGMGALFLATDPMLERQVAIKLLKEDDDELRERFAREARAVAKLHHANIVTIFDVGTHDGRPFIAMEYVEGQTLAQIIRERQALSTPRRLELIEELCDGLGFAHKAGIVHRDVKPANVMVNTEGSVRILDFGIARIAEASKLTRAGMLIGTLNYMSPEQVTGAPVDQRSDIFSVGLVLYEMLAYQKAFPGKALTEVLDRIVHGAPEPLSEVRRGIDPAVVRIVQRAMEKDPAKRYPDLRSMRRELQAARFRLDMADEPTLAFQIKDLNPDAGVKTAPKPSVESQERKEAERREAERVEAERKEAARVEAARLEAERKEAERKEAERVEAERQEAARVEAARLEAERQEAERKEAERVEAERQEAARVETARLEAERKEAERKEAERREAERVEAERQEAARVETARLEAERKEAERREAERLAKEALEIEGHLARAREALDAQQFDGADKAVGAALALRADHQGARQLRKAIAEAVKADKKRRKEEARQARQKEKRAAALLKKANKAKANEAAAAARTASSGPAGEPSFQRYASLARAEIGKLTTRVQTWGGQQWSIAAGAALVVMVGAYLVFGRGEPSALPTLRDTGLQVDAGVVLPGDRIALPALDSEGATPTEAAPPPAAPVVPVAPPEPEPTSPPPVEAGVEEDPVATEDPRLAQLRQRAVDEYDRGDQEAALVTAEEVLAMAPRDQALFDWLGQVQTEAYQRALQARQAADAFGPLAREASDYRTGAILQAQASDRAEARDFMNAVRDWWRSAALFEAALESARANAVVDVDMDAVNEVIDQYRLALEGLDVAAVQRVYPDVDTGALRDGFLSITGQRVEISNCRSIASTQASATVRCNFESLAQRPGGRSQLRTTREVMFTLRSVDGRWIITGRQ